jgi:branched-chain amino acid transport system permease protein
MVGVFTIVLLAFSYLTTNDPGSFAITIMSGLFQGMLLFLVASGLSIILGLMDILNLAQGAYFMLGAYVAYAIFHNPDVAATIANADMRFIVAVIVATAVGGATGYLFESILLRPLYDRQVFQLVLTFGVGLVILEVIEFIWSTTPYAWSSTGSFGIHQGTFTLFEQSFSTYRPFVILIGFILIILIALLLRYTRLGIIIRAGVEDSEMVEALGINVRAVFTLVFALGCAVAAFGGAIAAPFLGATIGMGNAFLLAAIAVVVLGGMGSYEGTAIGSILVGLSIAIVAKFATQYLNQSVWQSLTPMFLLILILLVRPSGLFGKEV